MQYRMERHFRNIYPNFRKLLSGSFLSALNFCSRVSKISGWMVRISEKFPEVWELFQENTVPIAAVSKVSYGGSTGLFWGDTSQD